jgi:16S rRNA (adenine1518-N6/adenine1519-N6)-dimethyltransferase
MVEIKAKKRFGQNFLKDSLVLDKIIEAMPNNQNMVVEIGPGLGDLTQKMLKYKSVTAYEVDVDLYNILQKKFANSINSSKLNLILSDVLDIWEEKNSLYDGKYELIANLPYYIATNIILKALDDNNCNHILVMVQKEVALKFSSLVGQKDFSALGVIADTLSFESKILFDVPPESFDPAPKVMSSILYIKKNQKKVDRSFKDFLRIGFSQPRKKLIKNLSAKYDKDLLESIFDTLNIDQNKRPHQIDSLLYHHIYEKVNNGRDNKQ